MAVAECRGAGAGAGVGDAKAVRHEAALELARRLAALHPDQRPQIGSPDDAVALVQIEMAALSQEQLRVVLSSGMRLKT
jgi:DNA repair protein RadC